MHETVGLDPIKSVTYTGILNRLARAQRPIGMPLYRQAGLLRRFGGDISSNTLAASVVRVGLAIQPVFNLMRDALLDAGLIYCDETTFQVLKEKGRRPQTTSYLWAQVTDSTVPIRLFTYTPGRGGKLAGRLFEGIREGAVIMSDGYNPTSISRKIIISCTLDAGHTRGEGL